MGGHATVTLIGGSPELLLQLTALADHCEALWSRFESTSDISRINWAEGSEVEVSPLTIRLIDEMRNGYLVSGGDFDPTLLPALLDAGYRRSVVDESRSTSLPSSAVSPGALSAIAIRGTSVTPAVGTTLDAGGIAKGLTADLVCELAMAGGADGVMAEICGDVVVAGRAPHDSVWHLAVEDPFEPDRNTAIVRLVDAALVTSSQRKRRWQTAEGERHHLLNPHTGKSAITPVQSATVIAATGAYAEVLTKPAFIRNTSDYLDWLPKMGAAGMVTLDDRSVATSSNWQEYL
jgi:FAD:protein FMN transferase